MGELMKDPYLKIRAYEFYLKQEKPLWHRFNLFEAAYRQMMMAFAGDQSHTDIIYNVLDVYTCASQTAEYPGREQFDVVVAAYLATMMKENSIGWYLYKKNAVSYLRF